MSEYLKINPLYCNSEPTYKDSYKEHLKNETDLLVKCSVPDQYIGKRLTTYGSMNYVESHTPYYIIELRAFNPDSSPDYILKNWNNSGINIKATLNNVHLTFLVKTNVPIKDAIERVTKTLEEKLSSDDETSSRHSDGQLAHQNNDITVSVLNPENPRFATKDDMFPEALLINEVNNDLYLTYVLFKAFHENYTIHDFTRSTRFQPHNLSQVKLSYVYPKEREIMFRFKNPQSFRFAEYMMDELVYLICPKDSNTRNVLDILKYGSQFTDAYMIDEKDTNFEVKYKHHRKYSQTVLRNELIIIKKPEALVFSQAFLEDLPSYTKSTMPKVSLGFKFKRYRRVLRKLFVHL